MIQLFNYFFPAWHVRLQQYYENEPEPPAEIPVEKSTILKTECGSGSEKENSSVPDRDGSTAGSGSTTSGSSANVSPIKKKKKRRISDSEDDDDDFVDRVSKISAPIPAVLEQLKCSEDHFKQQEIMIE